MTKSKSERPHMNPKHKSKLPNGKGNKNKNNKGKKEDQENSNNGHLEQKTGPPKPHIHYGIFLLKF